MARILVVDAQGPVRALTRRILIMDGHAVVDTGVAADALDALNGDRFDLMLVDPSIDDARDPSFLDLVRMHPNGRVLPIVVTSDSDEADGLIAEAQAGVLDHLKKPVGFAELQRVVARIAASSPETIELEQRARADGADLYLSTRDLTEQARRRN